MLSLKEFIDTLHEQNINMDSIMVIQNDELLAMHRFSDATIHNVYSIAKSYTATAIGIAIDEGMLALTDRPVDFFGDILPAGIDSRWENVTMYHLLTMSTGHGEPHMMATDRAMLRGKSDAKPDASMAEEWLLFVFSRPMVCDAGESFCYGNLAPYVAGRMLEKAVGCTICDYLYEKMWMHLGVDKPRWDSDTAGHTFAASDLYLNITDMIKLGQIYLGNGVYEGRRYLSDEWVKKATTKQVGSSTINPAGHSEDEEAGYGFYIWLNREGGYRAYGREGQFIIVLPAREAVIATQSTHRNVQQVLDVLWDHILPQL